MSEQPITLFHKQFPTIARMVEDSDSYRIEVTLPHDCIGLGATATAIFKHSNGRGFGCTWRMEPDLMRLEGCRNRRFDGSLPEDAPANADLLAELARRLATDGAALSECGGRTFSDGQWYRPSGDVRAKLHRHAY